LLPTPGSTFRRFFLAALVLGGIGVFLLGGWEAAPVAGAALGPATGPACWTPPPRTPTPLRTCTPPPPHTATPVPPTATPVPPTATATPVPPTATATPDPHNSCQFAILSFQSCMNAQGCVSYSIPLQNTAAESAVVDGVVVLQDQGGGELGHTNIPATTLAPNSITTVSGTVCGALGAMPPGANYHLVVTIQDVPRVCDSKTKSQPVPMCASTNAPGAGNQ